VERGRVRAQGLGGSWPHFWLWLKLGPTGSLSVARETTSVSPLSNDGDF
jgi:hypothetical protein